MKNDDNKSYSYGKTQSTSSFIRNMTRGKIKGNQQQDAASQKTQTQEEQRPAKKAEEAQEKPTIKMDRERMISLQKALYSPVRIIGDAQEIVPFAWRNPLDFSKLKRTSKYLKNQALQKEKAKKEREKRLSESQRD